MGRRRARISTDRLPILVAALAFTFVAEAEAANTFAGTWDTTHGPLTLDAAGNGTWTGSSYSGTIDGVITGDVHEGNWSRTGPPPSNGTYRFVLTPSGTDFTGSNNSSTGCMASNCEWTGTCTGGACLQNSAPCPGARRSISLMLQRACEVSVKWSFKLAGLPDSPKAADLPKGLVLVEAETVDAVLAGDAREVVLSSSGKVKMVTTYIKGNKGLVENGITFALGSSGGYNNNARKVTVESSATVARSEDPRCEKGASVEFFLEARRKEQGPVVSLELYPEEDPPAEDPECSLGDERAIVEWGHSSFQKAKIGAPKPVG